MGLEECYESKDVTINDAIKGLEEDILSNNVMNNDIDNVSFWKYVEKFFSWTKFDVNNTLKWFMKPENSLTSQEYNIIIKYLNTPDLTNNERIEFLIRLRDNLYKLKTNEDENGDKRILFRTALKNAIDNKNFSDVLSEAIQNQDEKILTSILFKYIDEWKDIFWDISVTNESWDSMVIVDENLRQILSKKDFIIRIDDLPESLRKSILTTIREKLNEKIKNLTKKYIDKNGETPDYIANNLSSHEDLYVVLKQYDTVQKFLKTPSETSSSDIAKRYRAILSRFWYKVSNVDQNLLKQQEEEEKRIREANIARIEQWKKRNQEINWSLKDSGTSSKSLETQQNNAGVNAGVQILEDSNVDPSELYGGTNNIELTEHDELYLKSEAFNSACNELLSKQGIITIDIMPRLYDIKEMKVNYTEWEKLKSDLKRKWIPDDDIKQSESLLMQFDNKIKSILENSYAQYYKDKEAVYDSTKLSAAWDVINSITYIFNSLWDKLKYWPLCEWFKYVDNNPIKIEWENMLISWTLNGTEINIKYNMKDWGLFMNSFIKENHMPNMYIIWDKNADYPLSKIDNFTEVLNKHWNLENLYEYTNSDVNIPQWPLLPSKEPWNSSTPLNIQWNSSKPLNIQWNSLGKNTRKVPNRIPNNSKPKPPIKPDDGLHPGRIPLPWLIWFNWELSESNKIQFEKVLWNTLDVIWKKVKNHIDEYSTINTVTDKLFNTIVPNYWNEIFVHEWSNIFDVLQILKNADESSLQYFNNEFMPKIMEFLWMKWWEYTMYSNPNKIWTNIENNPNSPRKNFIKKSENFVNDSTILGGRLNYDSNYNHCLSEIIKDVIKNDIKITKQNMKRYVEELENDKYVSADEELDNRLNEI